MYVFLNSQKLLKYQYTVSRTYIPSIYFQLRLAHRGQIRANNIKVT